MAMHNAARPTKRLREVLVATLLAVLLPAPSPPADALAVTLHDVAPTVETTPVGHGGDAADDVAIWVHPTTPTRSVVIGNDKLGALEVYDLDGQRIQRISEGFFGNVDVRQAADVGNGQVDLVVTYRKGVRVYTIDPTTRQLSNITDTSSGSIASSIGGEGLCLYQSPVDGSIDAFVVARDGRVAQYELVDTDRDGRVEGRVRRTWDVGGESEGCVADDVNGSLYLSEESVGIWKYNAEPGAPTGSAGRARVDSVARKGGHIIPDAEGLTIARLPGGTSYLVASSQAASNTKNSFLVYALTSSAFVGSFKVVAGSSADGCGRTDGIAVTTANLGPSFPNGMFICQDGSNTAPTGGHQNFKFVPLQRIFDLP